MAPTRIRSRAIAAVSLVAVLAAPAALAAQQTRWQLAGSNLFSSELHVLYGADGGTVLGDGGCEPGGPICEPSSFGVLFGAYGGIVPTEDVPLSIYGHLGVEYALDESFALGLLGFGFMQPFHGGVAARLDALDVGALKVGYGWGTDDGVLLAIEVAAEFLRDLFR